MPPDHRSTANPARTSSISNGNKKFKPHRPAGTSASAYAATTTSDRSRRPAQQRAPPDSSSDHLENEDEARDEEDDDAGGEDDPSSSQRPTIPAQLLTRLLHEFLDEDKEGGGKSQRMKISREANALVGKYMETFVREALARAAYERSREEGEGAGGTRDRFLEVEDLERLAPQLLLDF